MGIPDSPANDLPAMIRSLGGKIPFAHLRNIGRSGARDFHENAHPSAAGSLDMYAIVRALGAMYLAGLWEAVSKASD